MLHLGLKDDIFVQLKTAYDQQRKVVEEIYTIAKKKINRPRKKLEITLYHTAREIMVRGIQRNEWKTKEFNILKEIVNNSENKNFDCYYEVMKCDINELVCCPYKSEM